MSRLTATFALLLTASCAHVFPPTYDVDQLRADSAKWPGEGLVHLLTRPDPDLGAACRAETFRRTDEALVDPFVESLGSERLPDARWAECASRLLPTLPALSRQRFTERLSRVVFALVEAHRPGPVEAAVTALLARPIEPDEALPALRRRLERAGLSAPALAQVLELDEGRLDGAPLTVERLGALEDEALLTKALRRVPDEALRAVARRRIIQLHIARAEHAEVKARAAEVEEVVFRTGRWAQPVASLAPAVVAAPGVLTSSPLRASQNIEAQVVRLSGENDRQARIDLAPHLRFGVGWSAPLGLCRAPELLDVAPCIDAREVKASTPFGALSALGVLELREKLTTRELVELTRAGLGVVVSIELAGRQVRLFQLPLVVLQAAPFYFEGASTEQGPAVNVTVDPVTQGLIVEGVDAKGVRKLVVVPRGQTAFEFGSRGGRGTPGTMGTSGLNGSRGSNGSMASCPSMSGGMGGQGSSGGRGGDGGPGGPGGKGGPVTVELRCDARCEDEAFVRSIIRSRGGRGGPGGKGGSGGRGGEGGSGGSGTSCYSNGRTSSLSGGSTGARGSDGPPGSDGRPGADGEDGTVQLLVR